MALVKLKTHRCPTLSHLTEALEESFHSRVGSIYIQCFGWCTVDVPPQINVNGMHTLLIRSVGLCAGAGESRAKDSAKLAANDASIAASYELQNVE